MKLTTVLVVDDDVNMTAILKRLLTRPGRRVLVVNDGRAALDLALLEKPDLVILDVEMPGLSGHDVCWALRADERTRLARVMMLSGRVEPEDELAGLRAGADTYAGKPFDIGDFTERVDALLGGR